MIVDYDSYFITMYKRNKLHREEETEEREREKEEIEN